MSGPPLRRGWARGMGAVHCVAGWPPPMSMRPPFLLFSLLSRDRECLLERRVDGRADGPASERAAMAGGEGGRGRVESRGTGDLELLHVAARVPRALQAHGSRRPCQPLRFFLPSALSHPPLHTGRRRHHEPHRRAATHPLRRAPSPCAPPHTRSTATAYPAQSQRSVGAWAAADVGLCPSPAAPDPAQSHARNGFEPPRGRRRDAGYAAARGPS